VLFVGRDLENAHMPTKEWYAKNREKALADATRWHKENPDRARTASRKHYAKNPAKRLAATRAWYDENGRAYHRAWSAAKRVSDPTLFILRNAKNRAKKLGVEFNLVREDVVIPDICPVLGLKIEKSAKGFDPCSPSLDRFDGKKGYTKCNVRVISNRANILKRDGTLDEFKQLVAYMERCS
jgi:hypothetical protein